MERTIILTEKEFAHIEAALSELDSLRKRTSIMTSFPQDPEAGDIILSDGDIYIWDGTQYIIK